jgi:purine-binding chemotaxis protein CheW
MMAEVRKNRVEKRSARRTADAGRTEYLAFVLAGETYAIEVAHVAEILKPPPITEVPRAPGNVLGIIGVRGRLVTVVDLRRRFHLVERALDRRSRIILTDVGVGEQLGFLVDEVQQVWRLATEEIEPAQVLGGEQPAHIAGVGRPVEGIMLILLDARPIVESP